MDTKKVKKLNNAIAITSFVYAGLCFVTVILLWALGFDIYKAGNGANEEFGVYSGVFMGMMFCFALLVVSAVILLDGVPQIFFGVACITSKHLERTHKRAGKLMLLSLLDILGIGSIVFTSDFLASKKFTVLIFMAILLTALLMLKLVLFVYIWAKKKSLYGLVTAPNQSA